MVMDLRKQTAAVTAAYILSSAVPAVSAASEINFSQERLPNTPDIEQLIVQEQGYQQKKAASEIKLAFGSLELLSQKIDQYKEALGIQTHPFDAQYDQLREDLTEAALAYKSGEFAQATASAREVLKSEQELREEVVERDIQFQRYSALKAEYLQWSPDDAYLKGNEKFQEAMENAELADDYFFAESNEVNEKAYNTFADAVQELVDANNMRATAFKIVGYGAAGLVGTVGLLYAWDRWGWEMQMWKQRMQKEREEKKQNSAQGKKELQDCHKLLERYGSIKERLRESGTLSSLDFRNASERMIFQQLEGLGKLDNFLAEHLKDLQRKPGAELSALLRKPNVFPDFGLGESEKMSLNKLFELYREKLKALEKRVSPI